MKSQPQPQDNDDTSGLEETEPLRRIQELATAVAARDTFIAVAAHELRNPMMPIQGQVDLLISAIRANRISLEQALQKLERLQRTVHNYVKRATVLLDVSRINSGKFHLAPAPCDLAELVRAVADEFAAAALHAGVAIEVTAPPSCTGLWDRMAVEQVVDNLVSNALKYAGRAPVHLTLAAENGQVVIEVRDHGKGIAAKDRDRIFERFERAIDQSEYRSGFGVGLWVVGQLVDAMRGSIEIEDAPGDGALFRVRLPGTGK